MVDAMLRGELMELNNKLLTNKFNTKGAEWNLLSQHDAVEYLLPKGAAYDMPDDAKKDGVQFRWWQPVHRKKRYDQWAIDQFEVIQDHNAHNNRFISRSNEKDNLRGLMLQPEFDPRDRQYFHLNVKGYGGRPLRHCGFLPHQ
uniref:Reelin n=1 Tax=Magallana gigas TaxID=29159 RepID=K1QNF9_MAGGI